MSWSVSFSDLSVEELEELDAPDWNLQNGLARNSFAESKAVLVQLAKSGILGSPDKIGFSGFLNGHANADNNALPGWTPDCVSIHLSQVREPSRLDKAANAGS